MKKMLILLLTLAMSFALAASAVTMASAQTTDAFDGQTNLALSGSNWNEKFTGDFGNITEFSETEGILFKDYGNSQACASVALKQLMPFYNTITIKFTVATGGDGFLKVVFADDSGSANGAALKYWEAGGEHFAVEIKSAGVELWRYRVDDDPNTQKQQAVISAGTNYVDGEEHTLRITNVPSKTDFKIKMTIDGTTHFDSSVATSNMYLNSVLTIGAYSNDHTDNQITVSSVTVNRDEPDPQLEKDMSNLLYSADKWTLFDDSGSVTHDAEAGTVTVKGYTTSTKGIVYNEELPAAYTLTARLEMNDVPESSTGDDSVKGIRFAVLDNGEPDGTAIWEKVPGKAVYLQIDANGNMWLKNRIYQDGEWTDTTVGGGGAWVPSLCQGVNEITITVQPDFAEGSIEIDVAAGNGYLHGSIYDLSFVNGNHLTVGGYRDIDRDTSYTLHSLKIVNLLDPSPVDISAAANWTYAGSTFEDGIIIASPGYLATAENKPLAVEGEVGFTVDFSSKEDFTSWFRIVFATYLADANNTDATEGRAALVFTVTGKSFFTLDYYADGAAVVSQQHTTSNTATITGSPSTFAYKTEKTEEGLKLVITFNGVKEYEHVFENGTPFAEATGLYLAFRSTSANTDKVTLSDIYTISEGSTGIEKEIYSIPSVVTEENYQDILARVEEMETRIEALGDVEISNYDYLVYLKGECERIAALVADKQAAAEFDALASAVTLPDAIADDATYGQLAATLEELKTAYAALTPAQQVLVENYSVIEDLEVLISDYQLVAADKQAAAEVDALIAAIEIPEQLTADNVEAFRTAVTQAAEAYEALSENAASFVTGKDRLDSAVAMLAEYDNNGTASEGEGAACSGGLGAGSLVSVILLMAYGFMKKKD